MELLAFVFDEKHLEHALVIVQKRMLKKLVGTRSKRTCWQVRGKSGAKEEYLVYPTHYCSCRAFQWDVLSKGEQLICKHMLAVRVAEALDDYNSVDIDDALLVVGDDAVYEYEMGEGRGDRLESSMADYLEAYRNKLLEGRFEYMDGDGCVETMASAPSRGK